MAGTATLTAWLLISAYLRPSRRQLTGILRSALSQMWGALLVAPLVFGLAVPIAVLTIPQEMSMLSWTPLGYLHRFAGWVLRLGWMLLLLGLAFAPDRPWTRRIALAILILSAPSAIEEAYNGTWNNHGMLFWNDYPLDAAISIMRQVIGA